MAVLETKNLTHIFPDSTIGINNISIKINPSEFIIITGANGSGKTVFIWHLNGLLAPTKGTVLLDGEAISKDLTTTRKKIGIIFQNSDSQIVGQTVADDVAFGPENLNLPRAQVEATVAQALEATGLTQYANKNPHTLSGGQKRKLAIAGVLAMKPEIIILDEPFTGLDYAGVIQTLNQILTLHKSGHTIILVTHELEKALAHASRLVVFQKGTLVEDGTPQDIINRVSEYSVRKPNVNKVSDATWLK